MGNTNNKPLLVLSDFKREFYKGVWYEIARLPIVFEEECEQVKITFTETERGFDILSQGEQRGEYFELRGYITPLLYEYESDYSKLMQDGKFKLTMDYGIWSCMCCSWTRYYIIDAGGEPNKPYDDAMIGSPDRKYLWIICRNTKMTRERYAHLVNKAMFLGFDVDNLIMTHHNTQANM